MNARQSSPFTLRTVLGLVLFGTIAFIAMLYFIGAGDTGNRGRDGAAHAASDGLNGYSGLAKLAELEGLDVTLSRSPGAFETYDLLVLTPPAYVDEEEFAAVLKQRQDYGPTLVILPKWFAGSFPDRLPKEVRDQVKEGWVRLYGTSAPEWTGDLPLPYRFDSTEHEAKREPLGWSGMGFAGELPDKRSLAGVPADDQDVLVEDSEGGALVIEVLGEQDSDFYENAHNIIFVVEPDLVNNYGLADRSRAALAMELIRYAGYDDLTNITFDLTMNGFGGSTNLLTLAFRPPFLAATLSLILALLVIGWRAFRRFGPAIAEGPTIAFGKRALIANGAGLILRAKRLQLLGEPYIALYARRLKDALGLPRADEQAIDAAIARRLPGAPTFTERAEALRNARRRSDILRAASALKDIEGELTK